MKRLLLLLCVLLTCVSRTWADVLPNAVVGTYAFQATTLTTGASGHTITKDGSGNVTISPNNSGYFGNNSGAFTGTLVIKINVPETPTAGVLFEFRTAANSTADGSQGLFMSADRVLATSWTGSVRADANIALQNNTTTRTLTAGEHTIIYIAGDNGAFVVADATSTIYFKDSGLKRSGIEYKVIYIPAAYAQYITEVHYFSDSKSDSDKTTIFSECSNHMHASQQAGTTASVASGKTLILDKAVNWTSLTGTGTVLQEVNINTTVAGNLPALTLKATAGTLTYTGTSLNGTTLDGVILGGSARINTSNTVNIKNLAGNNISETNGYAFVGSGTLNFYGTCDLTKQSDGTTDNVNSKIGYGKTNYIYIKEDANVTTGAVFNTTTSNNNAYITVESGATLNATDQIRSIQLTNNGTIINSTSYIVVYADKTSTNNGSITATQFWGPITLAEGSTTTLSDASPFNSGAVTVSGDATLNLTNATPTLSEAITVASGKTLTIDGASNTVNLNVVPSMGSGSKINFQNATINYPNNIRNLADYTFTSSIAQFAETGDEYKAGGFTITNIPTGVTVKVKKYDATDYETVTPVEGTYTFSHEVGVGVSGLAAWLDYTFNMSTIESNQHDPADRIITNAGNAGSGINLTIDAGYNTDNSYNEDGTLKVMSTPWRDITWPTNYTVAVAGNVPDVENGCLVAFGSTTAGSKNYLAIIRGASQNEIKLVKGHEMNNAFEVISTMTAANATALSHLVVFTKNGNTFTVYLDGVQKTQVTYSDALGGGFQIGSLHGGVTGTGVGRVNDMSDAIKEKVFAKAIRVYDYVISSDQMEALTEEFPYTSFGGTYSRTISEDSDLSDTDAWLNVGKQGPADIPTNAVEDEVTYYPDVEITTTAASTLTVNADMDAENIKFEGAGKLTIASDGEHNIHIYGSLTANGPISVKYGETDLSAVPVTIGESGSVEFDFSASDFSSVNAPTNYQITGHTADYGSKVTGVYPADDYHTYTLAHNGSTNSYILTVGPSVKLKQEMAIATVSPYEDYIGTGIGNYTVSLDGTSYTSYDDFEDAVKAWDELEDCVEPTIAINQPATNKFYRFNIGSNYICNVAGNDNVRTVTTTSNDNSTIFYLNSSKYLIAYADGYGFNWAYCKAATGIFNAFEFFAASTKGKYLIHALNGNGSASDRYLAIDTDNSKLKADQGEWTITEVTSLPITIKKAAGGWASFYSPVALTIPENGALTVYYVSSLSATEATLTEIEDFIPANTAVLMNYAGIESDQTLSFETATTDDTYDDNLLEGSVTATSVNDDEMYTLQVGATGSAHAGEPGLYPKTEGTLAGFKAYLPVSAFNDVSPVKGLSFRFEDATGITRTEQVQGSSEYFNLAGQRVQQPTRGLYIVNGNKVIIK